MSTEQGKANHWGPQVKDRIKGPREGKGWSEKVEHRLYLVTVQEQRLQESLNYGLGIARSARKEGALFNG